MIVVDASVTLKWLVPEALSEEANALRIQTAQSGQTIVAPTLLPFEVANAIRQTMRRAGLPLADAHRLMDDLLAFPLRLLRPDNLHHRALAMSDLYGLAAAYDAHYLALAEMLDCDFWTADQRLINSLRGRAPFVKWIGDFDTESRG